MSLGEINHSLVRMGVAKAAELGSTILSETTAPEQVGFNPKVFVENLAGDMIKNGEKFNSDGSAAAALLAFSEMFSRTELDQLQTFTKEVILKHGNGSIISFASMVDLMVKTYSEK